MWKRIIRRVLIKQPCRGPIKVNTPLVLGYSDCRWHQAYYNTSGIQSDYYLPDDLFYVSIIPKIIPKERSRFYTDKNGLDKLKFPCLMPKTVGRIVSGGFLAADYHPALPERELAELSSVVVKPSIGSGGGRNVQFMSGANAANFAKQSVLDHPEQEYIFQEPLTQSPEMARLSPDSVNTFRIMTMNRKGNVHVVSSLFRVGRKGSKTDNLGSGGFACSIENGKLGPFAVDDLLVPFREHPDWGLAFEGIPVPEIDTAKALCTQLHTLVPELWLISWDVAINDKHLPVIIEMNVGFQAIDIHQALYGPVFKDYLQDMFTRTKPEVLFGCPVG